MRSGSAQIQEAQSLRVHPAAGARHGRGGRLLDAAAGPRQAWPGASSHASRRSSSPRPTSTPGIANVFTTFSTATPQLYVDVDRDKAQMLKVPVTGDLRGHARLPGLGLRQRLQHVRPHLARHGAGRRRYRLDPENVSQDPRAQRRRADGAARQPRDVQGDRRARSRAALQPVPAAEVNGTARPGISSGQALQMHARAARRASCRRASPSSGPTCPTRRPRSAAPATTSSCWRDLRVPGAGGAIRELVAAAGHHADRADVPALRARSACGCTGRTSTSSRRSASWC